MIPVIVFAALFIVVGIFSFWAAINFLCDRQRATFLMFIIPFCISLGSLFVLLFWSGEMQKGKIKYYPIQEIGTADVPVQVSALDSGPFNITKHFKIILYNPELYYLEEQIYIQVCKRLCIVKQEKGPTYRVVPRSFVEVQ